MFDSYNDFYAGNAINLRSALDSELNLFKIDLEEEDKHKAREYRCSLNEIQDTYAPETFFPPIVRKGADASFVPFVRKHDNELQGKLIIETSVIFDRMESRNTSSLKLKVDQEEQVELEDLDLEGSFISTMENPGFSSKSLKKAKSNNKRFALQENSQILNYDNDPRGFDSATKGKNRRSVLEKRPNGVKQKPLVACNCKKSKCLRLYCECFAKGLVCGVDCNCDGCHNNENLSELRELVVQETLEKNPFAFKSKYKKIVNENDKILHSRGCNCSKTGCVKNYCECYNAGTGCSRLCRCSNCKNENIEIDDGDVKIYYDRVLRRRRKRTTLDDCFQKKCEIIKKLKLV